MKYFIIGSPGHHLFERAGELCEEHGLQYELAEITSISWKRLEWYHELAGTDFTETPQIFKFEENILDMTYVGNFDAFEEYLK